MSGNTVAKSDTIINGTKFLREQVFKVETSKDGLEKTVSLKHPATGNKAIVIFGEQKSDTIPAPDIRFTPDGILNAFNLDNCFIKTDGQGNVNLKNTKNSTLDVSGDGTALVMGADYKTQTEVKKGIESTGYPGNNQYYSNTGWWY